MGYPPPSQDPVWRAVVARTVKYPMVPHSVPKLVDEQADRQPAGLMAGAPARGNLLGLNRDSIVWLAAVAVAFTVTVLVLTPLRMSLGWDEAVYASQISRHVPLMPWNAHRARGMPLLVAPVTLLTGSTLVLRVYLTLLAGAGLFMALLTWRGIRPAWVLALAGLIFGGLGIAESLASQVFPNYWSALGGVAVVGLFLQGWTREMPPLRILLLLATAVGFTALMRPADAIFLAAPLVAVAAGSLGRRSMARRSLALLLAVTAGLVVGGGEGVIEAYMYFHGPVARLHAASRAGQGTVFEPLNSLRVLGGGKSTPVTGWSHPRLLFWWAAFGVLVILGIFVTRRARGWLFAAAPATCAISIYVFYMFPFKDNARYLLPAWALLALPAADGTAWLASQGRGRLRFAVTALIIVFFAAEIGAQHVVLASESAYLETAARADMNATNSLRQLGIHRPCLITSVHKRHYAPPTGPAAYYTGCEYVRYLRVLPRLHGRRVVVLVKGPGGRPWRYARQWPAYPLSGTGNVIAYISPVLNAKTFP
jgi:hypothetical protein